VQQLLLLHLMLVLVLLLRERLLEARPELLLKLSTHPSLGLRVLAHLLKPSTQSRLELGLRALAHLLEFTAHPLTLEGRDARRLRRALGTSLGLLLDPRELSDQGRVCRLRLA
jgi:hypothetical protein